MLRFMRKRYNAGFVRGVRLGKMNERYRIIELLENIYPDPHLGADDDCEDCWLIRHAIELIKGEAK